MDSVKEQNQLISDSEVCYAVLGRAGDFILIDLYGPIEDAMSKGHEKATAFAAFSGSSRVSPARRYNLATMPFTHA